MTSSSHRREIESAVLRALEENACRLLEIATTGGGHRQALFVDPQGRRRQYTFPFSPRGHRWPKLVRTHIRRMMREGN